MDATKRRRVAAIDMLTLRLPLEMNIMIRAALLVLAACCTPLAMAEVLTLPQSGGQTTGMSLPERGQPMSAVQARYGAPAKRHAPVGGNKPQHPPITRWDYAEFSVFFEHEHVIDAVVKEAPKPLRNIEALKPSS